MTAGIIIMNIRTARNIHNCNDDADSRSNYNRDIAMEPITIVLHMIRVIIILIKIVAGRNNDKTLRRIR